MHVWIFGYGSLLWRPGFPFEKRHIAYLQGYERRLAQGSPDHRGTPERLGRVATLARAEGARCGGLVYAVRHRRSEEVLAALDRREQGGYERICVEAELAPPLKGAVLAITWIAREDNPYHLGPAPLDAIVEQVAAAAGPSGANLDYVLKLAETLLEHGIEDPHVSAIRAALLNRTRSIAIL